MSRIAFKPKTATALVASALLLISAVAAPGARAAKPMPALIGSYPSPGGASQMVYSSKYHQLFLRNSGSAIRVIDTNTVTQTDLHLATEQFSDIQITPSGDYLYAADFGSEIIGYDEPLRPSWVHRYNLATHAWQSLQAPKIAYKVEPLDNDRFVLQDQDQWIDVTINRWGPSNITELTRRVWWDYQGDIEYDRSTGRLLHGNSGISSPEVNVLKVVGDTFTGAEGSGVYGSAQSGGGSSVLSTDAQDFYYGRLQVEALDVRNNRRTFPGTIYAATGDYAFGTAGVYDADTGATLGSLGLNTSVYALSTDGYDLWAYSNNTLYHYALPEPTTMTTLTAIGAAMMVRRRRH